MKFKSIEKSYFKILKLLKENNKLYNINFTIENPRMNLIKQDNINYKQLLGELLYHLQGKDDLETITYYDERYKDLSDNNSTINAMLGARMFFYEGLFDVYQTESINDDGDPIREFACEHIVLNQFEKCIEKLLQGERYFNICIFNPTLDINTKNTSEISNLVFYIENNKLNLNVNIIQQEFYNKYPYISFILSTILCILSKKLKLECGNLTFNYTVCYINNDITFEEKLLYNNNNLLNNEFYNDLAFVTIFDLEILSRIQNTLMNIEDCKNKIKSIGNEYWQSIIASLIKLNTDLNDFDNFIIEEHKQCFFN